MKEQNAACDKTWVLDTMVQKMCEVQNVSIISMSIQKVQNQLGFCVASLYQ
jgi:hypothetical protein